VERGTGGSAPDATASTNGVEPGPLADARLVFVGAGVMAESMIAGLLGWR